MFKSILFATQLCGHRISMTNNDLQGPGGIACGARATLTVIRRDYDRNTKTKKRKPNIDITAVSAIISIRQPIYGYTTYGGTNGGLLYNTSFVYYSPRLSLRKRF